MQMYEEVFFFLPVKPSLAEIINNCTNLVLSWAVNQMWHPGDRQPSRPSQATGSDVGGTLGGSEFFPASPICYLLGCPTEVPFMPQTSYMIWEQCSLLTKTSFPLPMHRVKWSRAEFCTFHTATAEPYAETQPKECRSRSV